jgi:hypothetical protein
LEENDQDVGNDTPRHLSTCVAEMCTENTYFVFNVVFFSFSIILLRQCLIRHHSENGFFTPDISGLNLRKAVHPDRLGQ